METAPFYVLKSKYTSKALIVIARLGINNNYKVLCGEEIPKSTITFNRLSGQNPLDIMETGTGLFYLISNKIFEVLKLNQLSGWNSFPVEVYGKNDERIDGYQCLSITGRCSTLDERKSLKILKPPRVPQAMPYYVKKGLYFDINKWDGSDFFLAPNKGFIFVTQKVRNILESEKASNVLFINALDIEIEC